MVKYSTKPKTYLAPKQRKVMVGQVVRRRGAYPEYTLEDALAVLFLAKEPIGRKQISEILELGEGSVRTLLGRLTKKDLIRSKQRGHFLTTWGHEVKKKIEELFSEPIEVTVDGFPGVAIIVKNPGGFKSLELRDEAIKFDAKGAMILTVKNGEIVFPEDSRPLKEMYPEIVKRLYDYEEGDLIVITWADKIGRRLKQPSRCSRLKGRPTPQGNIGGG
ncbi:hypothetical protein PF1113 [Pyrococcus furiosus DSM 3638]|uniref:Uncharacterized protein n=1 Tax=Pyrococcus furiosus (strain ATCC 43587 / DSM 3638 / JCM 8422 / Vc1) TaxID=186497 RepID=Q8U1U2_PYRFU|nr:hypothetical protein PF1113 [Pyrococcus furiosus DSM 3638]